MSLSNLPRYIRQLPDGSWLGAPGKHGPWRSISAPQQALPWPTDGPAVLKSREPASVTPEATGQPRPLSSAPQAVLDAFRAALAAAPESAVKQSLTTAPPAPLEGEVGELVAELRDAAFDLNGSDPAKSMLTRAADLLEQLAAAAPAVVPVPVSEALIKAECALSDVAEGEPECDEGDLLQWAERRCATALASIRPVMKQHKIRTSEWPPLPAPQGGEVDG